MGVKVKTIMKRDGKSKRSAVEAVAIVGEGREREGILGAARVRMMMTMRTWMQNCLQSCKPWNEAEWPRRKCWWMTTTATSMKATMKPRRERAEQAKEDEDAKREHDPQFL